MKKFDDFFFGWKNNFFDLKKKIVCDQELWVCLISPTLGAAVTMGYNGQLVATTQKSYICTVQYNFFP